MKYVTICGINYTIEEVDDQLDHGRTFGTLCFDQTTIKINKNMDPQIKKETLCHEIIHGIFGHLGHEDFCRNEQLVQELGNAIAQSFEPKIWESRK